MAENFSSSAWWSSYHSMETPAILYFRFCAKISQSRTFIVSLPCLLWTLDVLTSHQKSSQSPLSSSWAIGADSSFSPSMPEIRGSPGAFQPLPPCAPPPFLPAPASLCQGPLSFLPSLGLSVCLTHSLHVSLARIAPSRSLRLLTLSSY